MGNDHMRRFFVIIFELFIVLKIYDLWRDRIGLSLASYIIFVFILFWVLNLILSKLSLSASWQTNVVAKFWSRMKFSDDWFGFFLFFSVVFGFFLSKLFDNLFIYLLIFVVGIVIVYKLFSEKKYKDYGLYISAFLLGIAFGTEFTNHPFIIFIFLLGFVLMYFLVGPGEPRPF